MADAPFGTPYRAAFLVLDSNGSPVLTGVGGSGMTLYGPDSAAALSTGTALTHFGGGYWGVAYAATALTGVGVYRYVVPSLTGPGGLAFANVADEFSVGPADPRFRTLRDLYTALRVVHLGDGETSSSTSPGGTTFLIDAAYTNYSQAGDYKGSELYLFEPGNVADANPVRVTDYDPTNGRFTFTPAITTVASGTDYLIGNVNGGGWTHQQVAGALRDAFDEAAPRQPVSDEVNVTTVGSAYEYTLPNTWRAVTGVWRKWPTGAYTGDWRRLWPRAEYEVVPDRRRLRLAKVPGASEALRLEGLVAPDWPAGMAGLVQVAPGWLLRKAAFALLVASPRAEHARQAASLYAWLERHPLARLPAVDEVALP